MTSIITILGKDAITLGLASNRQPELNAGNGWVHASNTAQAVRMCNMDPANVRLTGDVRVLAETILHQAIAPDIAPADLLALLQPHAEDSTLTREAILILAAVYAQEN